MILLADNPLVPNGIENLVLRCVICTQPIPARRARGRSKDTCGPECHAVLRAFRKYVTQSSKCPACYHPATPAERKEFVAWRKARGDRREKVGRPKTPAKPAGVAEFHVSAGEEPKKALCEATQDAVACV